MKRLFLEPDTFLDVYDVEENMHYIVEDKCWICDNCNEKNKPENC